MTFAGRAFLVLGQCGTEPVDLAEVLAGNVGFAILGEEAYANLGEHVSAAGDVNGDGYDDIAIVNQAEAARTELYLGAPFG